MTDLLPVDRRTGKRSWVPFRDRPASEAEIVSWFERVPDINIGVLCGEASGGLVVVDVDHSPSQPLHLPPTVCASTGRGAHYYFRADQPVPTRKFAWGEVRGEGAYVVLPPSVHPSGALYEWADFLNPSQHDLAELPEAFLEQPLTGPEEPNIYLRRSEEPEEKDVQTSSGSHVLSWAKSEEAVLAIMSLCGVRKARLGKNFRCVLPGHKESSPSASLFRHPKSGHIYYRDWHCRDEHEWYTIPEVYAAVTTGHIRKLTNAEQGVWLTRALAKAGLVKLPSIMAPRLPDGTPQVIQDVYEGFKELLAIHSVYDADRSAAPYTWDFAAEWTGRGRRQCGDAINWLLARGYLTRVAARGQEYRGKRLRSGLLGIGRPRTR